MTERETLALLNGLDTLAEQDQFNGAQGETCRKAAALVRSLVSATPPAGPVVWIAREKGTQRALLLSTGGRPERVGHEDGSVDYFPPDGDNLIPLGTWVSDLGLGLAPGECKRVRLTVEGERDG